LIFYTDHLSQSDGPLLRVRYFDHKSGFPVVAIGNQRVIGAEFLLYACCLKDPLDTQHFLNLISNGRGVFEVKSRVISQGQLARLFMRHHFRPKFSPTCGVFFQTPKVFSRQLRHKYFLTCRTIVLSPL
jgi:hypothetical protein